jgi:hypothetical protein
MPASSNYRSLSSFTCLLHKAFTIHLLLSHPGSRVATEPDKVVAPDVIGPFGSQPDAGPVTKPEATFLRLLTRHFQPLPSPDPLDPLVVDDPPGSRAQELCDLAVAVAAILTGKRDDISGEPLLIVAPPRNTSLRRTMLSEHTADPALGQLQL